MFYSCETQYKVHAQIVITLWQHSLFQISKSCNGIIISCNDNTLDHAEILPWFSIIVLLIFSESFFLNKKKKEKQCVFLSFQSNLLSFQPQMFIIISINDHNIIQIDNIKISCNLWNLSCNLQINLALETYKK